MNPNNPPPKKIQQEDKITFEMGLDDEINKEEMLDVFRVDPEFEQARILFLNISIYKCVCT